MSLKITDYPEDFVKEFEAGLVEKDDERWGGDGEFLKKTDDAFYVYNMTEQLWYNFLEQKRSWPEDYEHENGNYMCQCAACNQRFNGYKRRSICKLCHLGLTDGNKPKFNDPKQVILIPKDLNISEGKMIAQACHASLAAILNLGKWKENEYGDNQFAINLTPGDTQDDAVFHWLNKSFPKVTLECKQKDLEKYYKLAQEAGLPCSYIVDHGRTEFDGVATPTCVAIGPAPREAIDAITKRLRLYQGKKL